MINKLTNLIENKKIYITPYNDSAKILKSQLDAAVSYDFLGFVDADTKKDVYSIEEMHKYDYVLIVSENYYLNIYKDLLLKGCDKNKILNLNIKTINNFILSDINFNDSKPSNRKKITFFGNCQAQYLFKIFNAVLDYNKYHISYYMNYDNSSDTKSIIDAIKKTDILIYQPLSEKHGELSEESIKKLVRNDAVLVSFPYIYNNGLYSLEYNGRKAIGEEEILKLYKQGFSLEQIIDNYKSHKINFNLSQKFRTSLNILRDRESCTDIKISDFIKQNYRKKKLFLNCNHPTDYIYSEVLKQLSSILNLDIYLDDALNVRKPQTMLVPISPYDIITHGYGFDCETEGQWDIYGTAIITIIINNYRLLNRQKV